ncbi:MAG TPA: cobalamin-binding protein [Solirubrobacteraceae bacterium]|nr:cobalamin-binding protein [Solirubrobacteraceae bacterium]
MRIVSLVPHATELLFALGLGDEVIAVTHECDHPPRARELAQVTRDALPAGLSSGELDAAVRERTQRGEAIYELDHRLLSELEPELIVTQALCPVCAVSYEDVAAVAAAMPNPPRLLALDPHTLEETLQDVRTVAEATGRRERGLSLVASSAARIDSVRVALRGSRRPRVAALEWLDPVFLAGHWTPQLIELAGATDVLGRAGESSRQSSWESVAAARPEVVIVMPCGYDAARAHQEALAFGAQLAALGAERVIAVDAAAYFSRPGPRLIDGLELLAGLLHPDRFGQAPAGGLEVALGANAGAAGG